MQIVACEHVQYFLNMDDTLQTASDMKQSVRTTSKQPPNIVERCVDHSCIGSDGLGSNCLYDDMLGRMITVREYRIQNSYSFFRKALMRLAVFEGCHYCVCVEASKQFEKNCFALSGYKLLAIRYCAAKAQATESFGGSTTCPKR